MARSTKNLPLILKFKRQSQTVFITVSPRETVGALIGHLIEAINDTGGLKVHNLPKSLDDAQSDVELPDINIPKPSFETDSDNDDDDDDDDDDEKLEKKSTDTITLGGEDIKLALPKDGSDIYKSGFEPLDWKSSDKIEKLELEDYKVIAFGLLDEPFEITEPVEE
ncbi:DEKNAAC100791 [Brettanomyces naardenensis]|uniref:DEKNAAC100791 n=1 Tax=Brettanomyces naardenensis TaxID=13370 RepID=A0A448YF56_BRENA|nr:DEKNAAC100791 [Brettanomyces naardenensis]